MEDFESSVNIPRITRHSVILRILTDDSFRVVSQSQDKRGDFITWTLVGSSLDKKRVHEQETKSVDSPPLKKKPRKKNEPPG